MLPAVVSVQRTANQAFVYAVATAVVSLAPVLWTGAGPFYAVTAAGLGIAFVWRAEVFRRDADRAAAGRLFRYSIVYLAALFVALVVDRMLPR
jgi:protoheme IX farnesyltransferase